MPKIVIDKLGNPHSFPDQATPEQITAALGSLVGPPPGDKVYTNPLPPPAPAGSTIGNIVGPALNNLFNFKQMATALRHPIDTTQHLLFDPLKNLANVPEDIRNRNGVDLISHIMQSVPVVGPMLEQTNNDYLSQLPNGNTAALSKAGGDLLGGVASFYAPEIYGGMLASPAKIQPALQEAGLSTITRALKIPESIIKRTSTYKRTGDLVAGEREAVKTLADNNIATMNQKNIQAGRTTLNNAGAGVRNAETQADQAGLTLSRKPLVDAARTGYEALMDPVTHFGRNPFIPQSAVDTAFNEYANTLDLNPQMTPSEMGDVNRTIYKLNNMQQPTDLTSETRATIQKAIARAAKDQLDTIPGRAENADIYEAYRPAVAALSSGVKRASHQAPFSLADLASAGLAAGVGAAGGGATSLGAGVGGFLASQLRRPMPLSFMGQQMYNLGTASLPQFTFTPPAYMANTLKLATNPNLIRALTLLPQYNNEQQQ